MNEPTLKDIRIQRNELVGGNIIAHMRHMADCREARSTYFYRHSKLWRKLWKHLQEDNNGLIKHPDNSLIVVCRGSGHSISLRDTCLYAKNYNTDPPTEAATFSMSIEIEYIDEDNRSMDYPPTFTRSYNIQVPCELELDFSEKAFAKWTSLKIAEETADTILKEQETLLKLMKLHPDFVKKNS